MTARPLCLSGRLRQADAPHLQQQAMAQIENGALILQADSLEAIDFGPLQVLLCAAAEARRLGLPCQLDARATPAMDRALAAVRLPDAATHFTIADPAGFEATA